MGHDEDGFALGSLKGKLRRTPALNEWLHIVAIHSAKLLTTDSRFVAPN